MSKNPSVPAQSPLSAVKLPPAPAHLRDDGKRLWGQVVESFLLDDHQAEVLALACQALDRQTEARDLVDRDGAVQADRFGQLRAHPAIAIERDSRLAVARLLRELALEAPPAGARPPRTGGRKW